MSVPIPSSTLSIPSDIFINEEFTATITFQNTGTEIGFLPTQDLFVPAEIDVPDLTPQAIWDDSETRWEDLSGNPITTYPLNPDLDISFVPLPNGLADGEKLYSISLNYSSYGPTQPALNTSITMTASESLGAVLNTPYTIRSRGLFVLGKDAQENPITDPVFYQDPTDSVIATPVKAAITKSVILPYESPIASGPNYPVTYTLELHVAPNQQIEDTTISDILDTGLRYIDGTITFDPSLPTLSFNSGTTPALGEYVLPTTTTQDLIFFYGTLPATPQATPYIVTITYQAYVDYFRKGNTSDLVIDETNGTPVPIMNNATLDADSNTVLPLLQTTQTTFNTTSLSIYKSNSFMQSGSSYAGGTLTYTLTINVSDYFSSQNMIIVDELSSGQNYDLGSAILSGATGLSVNVINNGISGPAPHLNTTTLVFTFDIGPYAGPNVSPGSPIDTSQTGLPVNGAPREITIVYTATLSNFYDDGMTIDVLDPLDYVINNVTITGDNYDFENNTGYSQIVSDTSSSRYDLPNASISKSFYAYNGIVMTPPNIVRPGDTITYRIIKVLPLQNYDVLTVKDYLPPPIIDANTITTLDPTADATVPPSGTIKYGPTHSLVFNTIPYPSPILTTSSTENSFTLDYGVHQDTSPNLEITFDILYTVTVADEPFKNGLQFTNQANFNFGNTTEGVQALLDTLELTLGQPQITVTKSAVDIISSNTNAALNPSSPDITTEFGNVGNVATLPITTNPIDTNFSLISKNVDSIEANDQLRIVLLICNTGDAEAYDIKVFDTLDPYFTFSNFAAYYGDGFNYSFTDTDLFDGTGITFPVITSGECAFITYDLLASPDLYACGDFTNTLTVGEYYNQNNSNPSRDNYVGTIQVTPLSEINIGAASPSILTTVLSNDYNTLGVDTMSIGGNVADTTIGNELSGEVVVTFPEGVILNFSLEFDSQSDAVNFTTGTPVYSIGIENNIDPSPASGTDIDLSFGPILTSASSSETMTMPFTAIIPTTNTSIVDGIRRWIRGRYRIRDDTTTQLCTGNDRYNLDVLEPNIVITKTANTNNIDETTSPLFFDITVTNSGNSTAFDVDVSDILPIGASQLVYSSSSIQFNGLTTSVPSIDFGMTSNTVTASADSILPGEDFSFRINFTVGSSLIIGSTIDNTAEAIYYSIPNTLTGSPVRRDYTGNSMISLTTNPTICVTTSNLTYNHTSDNGLLNSSLVYANIGDTIRYSISFILPVGQITLRTLEITLSNMDLTILSTNPISFSKSNPIADDFDNLNLTLVGNTLTFTFGTDTNPLTSSQIINNTTGAGITYSWNIDTLVTNVNSNQESTSYIGTSVLNINDGMNDIIIPNDDSCDDDFSLLEPTLNISKTLNSPTGSNAIFQGQDLIYDIEIQSSNTINNSSAFQTEFTDVNFSDTSRFTNPKFINLPTGWTQNTSTLPILTANTTTPITPGTTINFQVCATLLDNISSEISFTNTGVITYKSGNGTTEIRDGTGGINDYIAEDPSSALILSGANVVKNVVGNDNYTIGETVKYSILVTLPAGVIPFMEIDDILPPELQFISGSFEVITDAASSGGLLTNDFNGTLPSLTSLVSTNNIITARWDNITVVSNTDINDNSFVLLYDTELISGTNGDELANPANIRVGSNSFSIVRSDMACIIITVIEPELLITKVADTENYNTGDIIGFTITIEHSTKSSSNAFNFNLTDNFPENFNLISPVQLEFTPNTLNNVLTIFGETEGFNITIEEFPLTTKLVITYLVQITDNNRQSLINNTILNYTSLLNDPNCREYQLNGLYELQPLLLENPCFTIKNYIANIIAGSKQISGLYHAMNMARYAIDNNRKYCYTVNFDGIGKKTYSEISLRNLDDIAHCTSSKELYNNTNFDDITLDEYILLILSIRNTIEPLYGNFDRASFKKRYCLSYYYKFTAPFDNCLIFQEGERYCSFCDPNMFLLFYCESKNLTFMPLDVVYCPGF